MLSSSTSFAENDSNKFYDNPYVYSKESDFIGFDDYLDKYGKDNVIKGFNIAEARNAEMLYKSSGIENYRENEINFLNEVKNGENATNDLFSCLSKGIFLGLPVIGVSDLPPDDPRFSVKMDSDDDLDVEVDIADEKTIEGNLLTNENKMLSQMVNSVNIINYTSPNMRVYY